MEAAVNNPSDGGDKKGDKQTYNNAFCYFIDRNLAWLMWGIDLVVKKNMVVKFNDAFRSEWKEKLQTEQRRLAA